MMHKIEIDDDVLAFLKKHAEPFEDTPNSVLRRLLLNEPGHHRNFHFALKESRPTHDDILIPENFPVGTPAALQQVLEVLFVVTNTGYSRQKATNIVAKRRNITPQSVIDKYCRQLGKTATEIDIMIANNINGLKALLIKHFPKNQNFINEFFQKHITQKGAH